VGTNQPTSTAIDAERVYDTISETIKVINARIQAGKKPTTIFIDQEVIRASLVTRAEDGQYTIAPLVEFA
jgi:anaerobic magnesium-protoporphyrin IX monomethyl ester cyclase